MLELYILFALTTAIVSTATLFEPVLIMLRSNAPSNITENPYIARMVFFCISFVAAPIIIVPVIFPNSKEAFIESMYQGIIKD